MPAAVSVVPQGDVACAAATASAAAVCTATIPKNPGRLNRITGFTVAVGVCSTGALTSTFTLSGLITGDLVYKIAQSTTQGGALSVNFPYPIPASAVNTDITGTLAAITNGGVPSVVLYGDRI